MATAAQMFTAEIRPLV
jgi:hypothetical protein